MNNYDRYIQEMGTLLAYYESERRRIGGFLNIHQRATVALSNIEFDVLSFVAKKGMNDKSKERISDIESIRLMDEKFSVLLMRYESVLRECDRFRKISLELNEKVKLLSQEL